MNPKRVSLLSALASVFLVVAKLIIGLMSHSVALVAESLHSTVDVASSGITYLGIKAASKPADKEHPYGHERYESVTGFVVVVLLFISVFWVLSHSVPELIERKSHAQFNIWAVVVMIFSLIINIFIASIKKKVGTKFSSIALIADAKSSRADVISSTAVLIAMVIVKFYPLADNILATLVALYIFYEAYHLAREIINSILDTANPKVETKIKRILNGRNLQYSQIKTRKTGNTSVAEITLHFSPELITSAVTPEVESVERHLIESIDELKDIYIHVKPVEFTEELVRPKFGKRYRYRKRYSQ